MFTCYLNIDVTRVMIFENVRKPKYLNETAPISIINSKKTPQLWKCLKPFDFWRYHSLIKHTDKTIFFNILAKFLVLKTTILLTFLSRMKGEVSECISERKKRKSLIKDY